MKTVAVIQARMGSTRLPGKVMMPLGDHPVLEWAVRACLAAAGVDEVLVATSTLPGDDVIEEFCEHAGVACFRGSESDVLSRFVGAAEASNADVILRLTADCPFLDPQVIGAVVRLRAQTGAHYCSNISPRTYADGLDVECFTRDALMVAQAEATRPIDRDTVTYWIARNRSRFPAEAVINPIPGQQDERWVLDTADDLAFCEAIAKRWPWHMGPPSQLDMLAILDREPELRDLNRHHVMNERFYDALAEEPIVPRDYARSQAQLARAEKVIPLGAQTFSKSKTQFPQPSPLFLSHGQGGEVFDIDGNGFVDLVSALLPNILGYRDANVDAAVRKQLASGISFSLATELEAELAETLCRLIPCAEMARFGKTGTDVTTAAVRLARAYTGRDRVLICGGYHGWADWSVERNVGVPDAVQECSSRVRFGDKNGASDAFDFQTGRLTARFPWEDPPHGNAMQVEQQLKNELIAAIIVEPESDQKYLSHLRWLCDRYGAVLIFDEVITGFRFHLGGAQALYGVTPDLACFGKAMANGMPLAALVGRRDIMARMAPGEHPNIFYSGTMFGETLSLAASIATIAKMERDNVIERIWATGRALADAVDELLVGYNLVGVIDQHGQPPLVRLKFRNDKIAALFRKEMIASGTLIIASHNICYAHTANDVKRILKSYDHALAVVADALRKGDIDARLAGADVQPMVRASA